MTADLAAVLAGDETDGSLRRVLTNTIATLEDNKGQVFDIYEVTRTNLTEAQDILESVQNEARVSLERVASLEMEEQTQKQRLAAVSGNFAQNSEDEIRRCYESVANVQVDLALERDNAKRLKERRDRLLARISNLKDMLKQAEHLAFAVGSVLSYLSSEIGSVVWRIDKAEREKFVGARIIKAQEEERRRISRDLHDSTAQDLANLLLQTAVCEKLIDYNPEEAKRNVQELRSQIKATLAGVRQVIFDMRPMALDDLGLVPALKELCRKLSEKQLLDTEFDVQGEQWQLAKSAEIAVFRIVQEALNNIVNHSGQRHARLRLLYTGEALSVLVEDRGKGFDEALLDNDDEEMRMGIVGMKERGRIIGAEVTVSSVVGKGTKVHIRVKKGQP